MADIPAERLNLRTISASNVYRALQRAERSRSAPPGWDDLEQAAALCRQGCPREVMELCQAYAARSKATWGAYGGGVRQHRTEALSA